MQVLCQLQALQELYDHRVHWHLLRLENTSNLLANTQVMVNCLEMK